MQDMLIIDATTNISDTISLKKPHDTNDESHHVDESHPKSSDNNERADEVYEDIIINNKVSKSENEGTGHRREPSDDVSDLQKLNKASLFVLLDSFVTLRTNREKSCIDISVGDIPDAYAKSYSDNVNIVEPSRFFSDACSFMGLFIDENEVKYLVRLTGAIIRNATSSIELEKSAMCERKKFELFLSSASSNDYFSSITMANHIKCDSSSSKLDKKFSCSLLSDEEIIGVIGDLGMGEKGGEKCIERVLDVKCSEEKRGEENNSEEKKVEEKGGEAKNRGDEKVEEKKGEEMKGEGKRGGEIKGEEKKGKDERGEEKREKEMKGEEKREEVFLKMLPLPTAVEGIHVLEFFSGIG